MTKNDPIIIEEIDLYENMVSECFSPAAKVENRYLGEIFKILSLRSSELKKAIKYSPDGLIFNKPKIEVSIVDDEYSSINLSFNFKIQDIKRINFDHLLDDLLKEMVEAYKERDMKTRAAHDKD